MRLHFYPNYWGGGKYNIKSELTKQGYRVHEANIGAFSSNYDRAVDLYYYIKGGRVDYGAAHAAMVIIVMVEHMKVLCRIGHLVKIIYWS